MFGNNAMEETGEARTYLFSNVKLSLLTSYHKMQYFHIVFVCTSVRVKQLLELSMWSKIVFVSGATNEDGTNPNNLFMFGTNPGTIRESVRNKIEIQTFSSKIMVIWNVIYEWECEICGVWPILEPTISINQGFE